MAEQGEGVLVEHKASMSLHVLHVDRWLRQIFYNHLMKLVWTMLIKLQLLANGKSHAVAAVYNDIDQFGIL